MTLQNLEPTRKQRFMAALALAGLTQREWLVLHHDVTVEHLYRVLTGERTGAPELEAAIDGFIQEHLPAA